MEPLLLIFLILIDDQIFCWNCRGAKSSWFFRELKEFKRIHRPAVIILLESKISESSAIEACKKMEKTHWIRSEADGFSGGVWLLRNEEDIKVSLRYAHKYFHHVGITSNKKWELTAVYVNPNSTIRRHLWPKLDELRVEDPWVLIRYFNCTLKNDERSSNKVSSSNFRCWVTQKGLIDMG